MKDVSLTDLWADFMQYLKLIETGEVVRVVRDGKPFAEIRPVRKN